MQQIHTLHLCEITNQFYGLALLLKHKHGKYLGKVQITGMFVWIYDTDEI